MHPRVPHPSRISVQCLVVVLVSFSLLTLILIFALHGLPSSTSSSLSSSSSSSSSSFSPSEHAVKKELEELLSERQRLLSENAKLRMKLQDSRRDGNSNDNIKKVNEAGNAAGSSPLAQQRQPWLIIGIPTVPRNKRLPNDPDHRPLLLRTLESLRNQLYKPTLFASLSSSSSSSSSLSLIKVVVVNNRPGEHAAFLDAKNMYQHEEQWVEFLENESPYNEAAVDAINANVTLSPEDAAEFASRRQEAPTDAVRRQTLDVASLLDKVQGRSRYFLFYEDDFHFCDGALLHLINLIERSNIYYGGVDSWSAIRCSYGLAGIVMQNGGGARAAISKKKLHPAPEEDAVAFKPSHNDVAALKEYFLRHYRRRPPDHLAVEFYAKESRPARTHFRDGNMFVESPRGVVAYKYNILRHDGAVSTLREEEGWSMPGCFELLVEPQVFAVEAWSAKECPDSDMWPCQLKSQVKLSKADAQRGRGFDDLGDMKRRDA